MLWQKVPGMSSQRIDRKARRPLVSWAEWATILVRVIREGTAFSPARDATKRVILSEAKDLSGIVDLGEILRAAFMERGKSLSLSPGAALRMTSSRA